MIRVIVVLFLLVLMSGALADAHADDYWRGWCRGQVQAANTLQEARDDWLGRALDAFDQEHLYWPGFRIIGMVVDTVLKQLPVYIAPTRARPGQPTRLTVHPEGHVIECPSGDIVTPGPEARKG